MSENVEMQKERGVDQVQVKIKMEEWEAHQVKVKVQTEEREVHQEKIKVEMEIMRGTNQVMVETNTNVCVT